MDKKFPLNGTHEEEGKKCPDLHKVGNHYENLSQKLTPEGDFLKKGASYKKKKVFKR